MGSTTQQPKPLRKGHILRRIKGPQKTLIVNHTVTQVHQLDGVVECVRLSHPVKLRRGSTGIFTTDWLPVQEDGLPSGYRRETREERDARKAGKPAQQGGEE